jgi:hypothetical protein
MAYNNQFLQKKLKNVTHTLMLQAIQYAQDEGVSIHAPLGSSGDTFMLYGEPRSREVSLRLYNGNVELLVTNDIGEFLFYGRFNNDIVDDLILAIRYSSILALVSDHMNSK